MGMEGMHEAMTRLSRAGYTEQFAAENGSLRALRSGGCYRPEVFEVDEVVRFEGESSPEDEAILFALRSFDGTIRGTYTGAYGPALSAEDARVIGQLRMHRTQRFKGVARA